MKRVALILAGGAGTRLHPLSTDDNPKQFLRIFNGNSLLEKTAARVRDFDATYISTNERYANKCRAQVPDAIVIAEPERRNNAPAIALSCFQIEEREGECVIVALPSDHHIRDEAEFQRVLDRAIAIAETSGNLVTIAIEPTEANTGYGYLELSGQAVARFIEKPPREKAEEFLRAGNYAWNAGIFIWRASVFRRTLEAVAPELAGVTRANYGSMPSISIDYALMEKAPQVAAVRGDFGWSDVGSFDALRAVGVDVDALLKQAGGVVP